MMDWAFSKLALKLIVPNKYTINKCAKKQSKTKTELNQNKHKQLLKCRLEVLWGTFIYLSLLSLDTTRDFSSRYFSMTALQKNKHTTSGERQGKTKMTLCCGRRSHKKTTVTNQRSDLMKHCCKTSQETAEKNESCCLIPPHDSALQVVELNELPEATGVVIVWSPGVAKGLHDTGRLLRCC